MNLYLSITLRTFTIWIMTSVINGVLTGAYLGMYEEKNEPILSLIIFCGLGSLFFSIPGFFIFWIRMLIAISRYIYGRALFRTALSTAIFLSAAAGITCSALFKTFSSGEVYVFPVFIIISAITGVMMHFNLFKKIGIGYSTKIYNQTAL